MKEIINITDFRNSIVNYQQNHFQAFPERSEMPLSECMTFIKNNKRKKVVLSTSHALLTVKCDDLLRKASQIIENDAAYSDTVELFYDKPIDETTLDSIIRKADSMGIIVAAYDSIKLSEINDFSNVFKKNYEIEDISPAYRVLYDMLSEGSNVSQIKNSIVYSMIVLDIYNAQDHTISEKDLEEHISEKFPSSSINQALSYLTRAGRITSPNKGIYTLNKKEKANVEKIIEKSRRRETDFINQFNTILVKYNIDNKKSENLILQLKKVYEENFKTNLHNPITAFDEKINTTFNEFKDVLKNEIPNIQDIDAIIADIRELCTNNTFLNRISASESFVSLYDSPELMTYLDQKSKHVYLDTPVLVYYICSKFGAIKNKNNDWDNNLYLATKHLLEMNKKRDDVSFYTIEHYIKETAGELRKALRIASYERYGILYKVPETGNTFYNYYQFLRKSEIIDSKQSLASFLKERGFKNIDSESENFINDACKVIKSLLNYNQITYDATELNHLYQDALKQYTIVLWDKKKDRTPNAMKSDVNLVLHLTSLYEDDSTNIDYYICSWDSTFTDLAKWVVAQDPQNYHMFSSYNPSKLANKISFEKFNIDAKCITDSIFAYADENYELSTKVRNLYDNDLSKISNKEDSLLFIDKLEELKDKYLYQGEDEFDNEQRKENISLDAILEYLTEKINNQYTTDEFDLYYKTNEGKKAVYDSVENALKAQSEGSNFRPHIDNLIKKLSNYISKEGEKYQPYL